MDQENIVEELQNHIDISKAKASPPTNDSEGPLPNKAVHRAATALVDSTENPGSLPKDMKVGRLLGPDGTLQFVVLANGVWNSIRPIVENLVRTEARDEGLSNVGQVEMKWRSIVEKFINASASYNASQFV